MGGDYIQPPLLEGKPCTFVDCNSADCAQLFPTQDLWDLVDGASLGVTTTIQDKWTKKKMMTSVEHDCLLQPDGTTLEPDGTTLKPVERYEPDSTRLLLDLGNPAHAQFLEKLLRHHIAINAALYLLGRCCVWGPTRDPREYWPNPQLLAMVVFPHLDTRRPRRSQEEPEEAPPVQMAGELRDPNFPQLFHRELVTPEGTSYQNRHALYAEQGLYFRPGEEVPLSHVTCIIPIPEEVLLEHEARYKAEHAARQLDRTSGARSNTRVVGQPLAKAQRDAFAAAVKEATEGGPVDWQVVVEKVKEKLPELADGRKARDYFYNHAADLGIADLGATIVSSKRWSSAELDAVKAVFKAHGKEGYTGLTDQLWKESADAVNGARARMHGAQVEERGMRAVKQWVAKNHAKVFAKEASETSAIAEAAVPAGQPAMPSGSSLGRLGAAASGLSAAPGGAAGVKQQEFAVLDAVELPPAQAQSSAVEFSHRQPLVPLQHGQHAGHAQQEAQQQAQHAQQTHRQPQPNAHSTGVQQAGQAGHSVQFRHLSGGTGTPSMLPSNPAASGELTDINQAPPHHLLFRADQPTKRRRLDATAASLEGLRRRRGGCVLGVSKLGVTGDSQASQVGRQRQGIFCQLAIAGWHTASTRTTLLTDLYGLLKAAEASPKVTKPLVEALCRRSLMAAWAKFCNSIASPDVLQALGSKQVDHDPDPVLFCTLLVQHAAFRIVQGLPLEEGCLNLTESWLCCGGWKFTLHFVQHLTAYMKTRKASSRYPLPQPGVAAHSPTILNSYLMCIYNTLFLASRPDTPYAETTLSEEGIVSRLVDLVSEAQQASDEMLDWGYSSIHLLMSMVYPDPIVGPSIYRQCRQVFAAPSSSLLQALRFWWLQAAQAPAGAHRGHAGSVVVVSMLQDAVIRNACAVQDSSAAKPPKVCLAALFSLILLLTKAPGKVLRACSEEGVLDVVHRPTLNVLLRSKAPVLVEAALRTNCRWLSQPELAPTAYQSGLLATSMCALLDGKVGPKGALSMLATLRKAMLFSGSDTQLAAYCMLATEALVRAACKPGKAGQEAAMLTGGTHAGCDPSRAIWEPVQAYAAAWVLPTMLGLADAFLDSNECQPWLSGIARHVALLAVTGALDDAIVRHLCTELARLAGQPILSQEINVLHPMSSVHLLINITKDVVNYQPCPGGKGSATFFGLLATDVLPVAASLLPVETQTAHNVLALTRPFGGMDLHEAVNRRAYKEVIIAEHEKLKALAAMAELMDALEAVCGPLDQTGTAAAADLELARLAALRAGCHNPGCKDVAGATEAELPTRKCSGCKKAHYCSAACQKAAWKVHKRICKACAA
ncbi:hypothetical protein WJX72_012361 [[Myrmecia] bisecta]|uniref:MYND-type domain-containing protein n=1 Tax=[Myrmecia] bisecta TaxID=41462 RepID=A0AAW1PZR3_9CHLO